MRASVTGGKKLEKWLNRAKMRSKSVSVGFFSTARYSDGTPVAAVAAWNHFGVPSRNIPERPFMCDAIEGAKGPIMEVLERGIDPKDLRLDGKTAGKMGLVMQAQIVRSITELSTPANAASTIKRKGSSNPLIDEAHMRGSVSYLVE